MVDVADARGLEDLASRLRVGVAVGDVVVDRAAEQPRILQHHAGALAQIVAGHRPSVDTVDGDRARVDVVEPHDQVHQRRLARAGRPDDRDHVAGLGHQRQLLDQRLVRQVAERRRRRRR